MSPASPPITESLAFALHRATVLVDRAADLFLRARHDVSYSLFSVLLLIGTHDGPTQREVADMLGVSRASITQRVAELRRRGLVLAEAHPTDARAVTLTLTPEGGTLLERAWRDLESGDEGIDAGVDLPTLLRHLQIITRNAETSIRRMEAGTGR